MWIGGTTTNKILANRILQILPIKHLLQIQIRWTDWLCFILQIKQMYRASPYPGGQLLPHGGGGSSNSEMLPSFQYQSGGDYEGEKSSDGGGSRKDLGKRNERNLILFLAFLAVCFVDFVWQFCALVWRQISARLFARIVTIDCLQWVLIPSLDFIVFIFFFRRIGKYYSLIF